MSDPNIYNKLVRDRIPAIIRKAGKTPCYSHLSNQRERIDALRMKLLEESQELFSAESQESFLKEAADMLQVVQQLAREHDIPWETVLDVLATRNNERGGFLDGIFLHAVWNEHPPDNRPNADKTPATPRLLTPESDESVVDVIRRELRNSSTCRIATAFCTRGMLNLLIRPFQEFVDSGGSLQLLTSTMNHFNNPDDLNHIQDHVPGLKLRVFFPGFNDDSEGPPAELPPPFHLKCFLFEKKDGHHSLIVGSSNLTRAGLSGNCEWNLFSNSEVNLPFPGRDAHSIYSEAQDLFSRYWEGDAVPLSERFLAFYRPLHERARRARQAFEDVVEQPAQKHSLTPRPAQREALEELNRRRWLGVERTAVIAATGLGKTHLAAFDFQRSKLENVLFVVHRESILRKARETFADVLGDKTFGTILTGHSAEDDRARAVQPASSVFATIQTLSQPQVLEQFSSYHFDYIVLDEFHHSQAPSYRRVLGHFEPQFFLGLTATPERMDGRDVLEFCEYDVAYEARLFDAIDNRWLTPFQYFAIHDETDYSRIRWTGTGYDEHELEKHLSRDTRAELISSNLRQYLPADGKVKALAFCSSKGHARYMAEQFNQRGFHAAWLLGESSEEERSRAVARLQDEGDPLQVICSVDIFGEGVDIPALTHVLMLRPTQSVTVFLQQLGRGLRRMPSKDFLVVLDFIGNYRNSYVAPLVFRGFSDPAEYKRQGRPAPFKLPAECTVQADTEVRRIWDDEFRRVLKPKNIRERLADVYRELRANLDHSPSILDFFANPEACDPHKFVKTFENWLRTKEFMEDLNAYEREWLGTPAEAFLQHIEKELNSVKSYKMVVLMVLLNTDTSRTKWTVAEIAEGFREHYLEHLEQMWDYSDMARSSDPRTFSIEKVVRKLSDMPLNYLSDTEDKFFHFDRQQATFSLKSEIHPFWENPVFREQVADRILYALKRYFHRKKADLDKYRFDPRDLFPPRPRQQQTEQTDTKLVAQPGYEAEWELLSSSDAQGLEFVTALPLVASLAAGRPYDAFQSRTLESDTWVRVPEHYVKRTNFVVRVNGESMQPTLSNGDLVLCEWHRTPRRNGQVVIMAAFEAGGEGGDFALKRFEGSETHWLFHSDNPEEPDPPPVSKLNQPSYPILGIAHYNLTKSETIPAKHR